MTLGESQEEFLLNTGFLCGILGRKGGRFYVTVCREVMEEAGLKVKNLLYFDSQPWGYASNLLRGYFCELDGSGEIHMDEEELQSAVWVRREELEPVVENILSLTGTMIETFRLGKEKNLPKME